MGGHARDTNSITSHKVETANARAQVDDSRSKRISPAVCRDGVASAGGDLLEAVVPERIGHKRSDFAPRRSERHRSQGDAAANTVQKSSGQSHLGCRSKTRTTARIANCRSLRGV